MIKRNLLKFIYYFVIYQSSSILTVLEKLLKISKSYFFREQTSFDSQLIDRVIQNFFEAYFYLKKFHRKKQEKEHLRET